MPLLAPVTTARLPRNRIDVIASGTRQRGLDQGLAFVLYATQMLGATEAFRIELVDILGAARASREPRGLGHDPVTFVIVLWLEPRDEMREPEWRWRVREVRDGEEASFRRLDDVLAYIAARSGTAGPA